MGADPVEPTIYLLAPLNGGAILEAGGAAGSNLVSHWAILGWGWLFRSIYNIINYRLIVNSKS